MHHTYLALRNEDGHRVVLARSDRKVRNPLHTQLIPDLRQVLALVELDFVGDDPGTVTLVGGVLKVPARLRLLDELAHRRVHVAVLGRLDDLPDLQVLDRIAVGILGRALPGDQVGSEGRESQLENVISSDGRDHMSDRGIDDGDPSKQLVSFLSSFIGLSESRLTYFSGDAHAKYRPQGE